MRIQAERVEFSEIADLREGLRSEAQCQIVRDSILSRGLADPYLIRASESVAGYGGVWNEHFPNRIMEFFVAAEFRHAASDFFLALIDASRASHLEAQTNLDLQYRMIRAHVRDPTSENILFGDGPNTALTLTDVIFRARSPSDLGPGGEWVAERSGEVVGAGGLLHHYNPPFADLFVEVVPTARGLGIGSFLVQELRSVCRELGKTPAARCDPENHASRRALERGGLVAVGQIVAGPIVSDMKRRTPSVVSGSGGRRQDTRDTQADPERGRRGPHFDGR